MPSSDITVVIVAGGNATRLPGKLALDAGGLPMLVRVFRNVTPGRPAVIAAPDLDPQLARLIDAAVRPANEGPSAGRWAVCSPRCPR